MLSGKNIVLTGANSGIGLEVLKLLVEGGNKVLAVDLRTDRLKEFEGKGVTPMVRDISDKEGVDAVFAEAEKVLGKIDIFYANAGFPYFEAMNYTDWDRTRRIFDTNTISVIYSYEKFREHLAGREGRFAITVSAIGKMAMPGYALYSASKFAVQGFQQALRLELPENIGLTCLYPVATDTGFFKAAAEGKHKTIRRKPFPVQKPAHVAKAMVKGLARGKKTVNPCKPRARQKDGEPLQAVHARGSAVRDLPAHKVHLLEPGKEEARRIPRPARRDDSRKVNFRI